MKIKLRLGDTVDGAAGIFDNAKTATRALGYARVKGAVIFTVDTANARERTHAMEILYYIESSPAGLGLDGADITERSACVRTAKTWRKKLGIGEHATIETPASAGGAS